jgi:hypothetical protein
MTAGVEAEVLQDLQVGAWRAICGVIVYNYPPPACYGRRLMLPRMTMQEINQQLSTINHVVVQTKKYRTIGVGNKLKNDRILKIHFHTLRHWKATMEYAKTKDILHVMKMLGHRNIQNTLLYTQLISFESDQFHSATAKTILDAQKLIEAGFEYVCEFNETKIFKKRK